jgi:hypothetical protein
LDQSNDRHRRNGHCQPLSFHCRPSGDSPSGSRAEIITVHARTHAVKGTTRRTKTALEMLTVPHLGMPAKR